MNTNVLLDLATDLGYELAMSGAETFRVEESITLVLATYGLQADVFAIPNCLTVSVVDPDGQPVTRMRRIGFHGNDIDSVERFTALSRRICFEKPEPADAEQWLRDACKQKRTYRLPAMLAGNFLGAFGFGLLFGGNLSDALCAGICGILVGLINRFMDYMKANQFFRTLAAAFPMALLAYGFNALGVCSNADVVAIGALMILVPGLLFTNAMRDIIFGDTNSGTNRIVTVLLIAVAIACGTAAAWNSANFLWGIAQPAPVIDYTLLQQVLPCMIACIGFGVVFNVHGPGMLLCAAGGVLTWAVYRLTMYLGGTELMAFFWGTFASALYSEIMARIRKCPAIGYLVIAIFPLIPGAGVYYTMRHAVRGEMDLFVSEGMHTAAEAGIMAIAILLVSTTVRMINTHRRRKRENKSK